MRRKIRDTEDAVACLEQLEKSGLTLSEWARQNGVDARSLHCWRMAIRKRRSGVVELVTTRAKVSSPTARYIVRTRSFEVEVDDHFSANTLARLLDVVASC